MVESHDRDAILCFWFKSVRWWILSQWNGCPKIVWDPINFNMKHFPLVPTCWSRPSPTGIKQNHRGMGMVLCIGVYFVDGHGFWPEVRTFPLVPVFHTKTTECLVSLMNPKVNFNFS